MIPIRIKDIETILKDFEDTIESYSNVTKEKLMTLKKKTRDIKKKKYLQVLIDNAKKLILLKPTDIHKLEDELCGIIPQKQFEGSSKTFKDSILDSLQYEKLRSDFYPQIFYRIGIKACVYCNAHLTVGIEKKIKLKTKTKFEYKSKFQLDHYYPKSIFPGFSISIFNLFPVCANCNLKKGKKRIDFELYTSKRTSISKFKFVLPKGCVAKYLNTKDNRNLEIDFIEPKITKAKIAEGFEDISKILEIKELYNTQLDLVEEIIIKSKMYTKSYKNDLLKNFPTLLTNKEILNRILLGNYCTDAEIHKRPMAKLTMDIAKQLKIID